MVTIKVSRNGLTRCPSCSAHIHVAERVEATICPFCQAELPEALAVASRQTSPLQRLLGQGRSAVIAASLLGLPLSACDDPTADSSPPADVGDPDVQLDVADDNMGVAVYGMPATDTEQDLGPSDPDAGSDIQTEVIEDPPNQPEYGLPPEG